MPPRRRDPGRLLHFNPLRRQDLDPVPAPDANEVVPWMLSSKTNLRDAICYFEDALLFNVSNDYNFGYNKHRFTEIRHQAEIDIRRRYAQKDITIWKELQEQAADIAKGAIGADGYISIRGVNIESRTKKNTVEFLATIRNEADPREVARCFKVPGATVSVLEALSKNVGRWSTSTLMKLVRKVLQLLLSVITSDHLRTIPLEQLRNAQWRVDHLWGSILNRPTMCYLYEHAEHILELPLIFNKHDDIDIGHGTPRGTKLATQTMLKANCVNGMDMVFRKIARMNVVDVDPQFKIPFDMGLLCTMWKGASKKGQWGDAMRMVEVDNFPVVTSRKENTPDDVIDTDNEDSES